MALFVSAYSRVRVASERGKRDKPGIARGMEHAKLNYDPRFTKCSLRTAFAQKYYINYKHKSII